MRRQFSILKDSVKLRGSHNLSGVYIFSSRITCDVYLSYPPHLTLKFIVLTLDLTNEFLCGMMLLYLMC